MESDFRKVRFYTSCECRLCRGVIITDWYGDTASDEEIKVAVRFLTNEIRSDAIDVIIYKKGALM